MSSEEVPESGDEHVRGLRRRPVATVEQTNAERGQRYETNEYS